MQFLMSLFFLGTVFSFFLMYKASKKGLSKKKYFISGSFCFVFMMIFYSLSPKEEVNTIETKFATTEEKKDEKSKEEKQKKSDEEKKKKLEDEKSKEEKKQLEEQRKKEDEKKEEQKKKDAEEKQKTAVNNDKNTYLNEIKPTIDSMMKEYDEIWNQEWRPIWTEVSKDVSSMDPNVLKEKMELIINKYDALSKKNTEFKDTEKLGNSVLKEKIEKFRVEFGLATNYRSNAANAVQQGLKGVAPMKGRMEEAQKSIKLSDQKIINAAANLVETETQLGIKRN